MSVITDCPYICAPNIMDTPDYQTKMVTLDMTDKTVIKAGTPISADGKVANDETAIGVLLNDCHACLGARRGLVVISGRVKQDVAADHSGITISDEAKSAMINLTFTGDGARGGGGGVQADWNEDDPTSAGYVKNRPGGYDGRMKAVWKYTWNFTAGNKDGVYESSFQARNSHDGEALELCSNGVWTSFDAETVDVVFNGVRYENVPFTDEYGSKGTTQAPSYIGDENLAEYPFCIFKRDYIGGGTFVVDSTSVIQGEVPVELYFYSEEMTRKIPRKYLDGALPSVSSADAGKILQVSGNDWKAVDAGYATEADLQAQVETLTATISALEARITALEA